MLHGLTSLIIRAQPVYFWEWMTYGFGMFYLGWLGCKRDLKRKLDRFPDERLSTPGTGQRGSL